MDDAPAEKGSGKKKSKQASSEERMKTMNVQLLIPEVIDSTISFETTNFEPGKFFFGIFQPEVKHEKHECSSELRFGGQMCIKAYVHGKATVREASQVILDHFSPELYYVGWRSRNRCNRSMFRLGHQRGYITITMGTV